MINKKWKCIYHSEFETSRNVQISRKTYSVVVPFNLWLWVSTEGHLMYNRFSLFDDNFIFVSFSGEYRRCCGRKNTNIRCLWSYAQINLQWWIKLPSEVQHVCNNCKFWCQQGFKQSQTFYNSLPCTSREALDRLFLAMMEYSPSSFPSTSLTSRRWILPWLMMSYLWPFLMGCSSLYHWTCMCGLLTSHSNVALFGNLVTWRRSRNSVLFRLVGEKYFIY